MTAQEIKATAKAMNLWPIIGALGEIEGCGAYAESERITDNGWETKYFGIASPFKGKTDNDIIDRVSITKKAFIEIIRLLPLNVFRIVKSLLYIYRVEGGLKSRCLKDNEFCPACRELIRAGKNLLNIGIIAIELIYCFAMFLQFSPSYRVRVQDWAGIINKENLKRAFLKELWRVKKVMLAREIGEKKKMRLLLNWLMILAVLKRKQIKDFLWNLDLEKVKLDIMDRYFCLRRTSYNFWGLDFKTRLEEAKKIDLEQGNIILNI